MTGALDLFPEDLRSAVERSGVLQGDLEQVEALAGGVSSDIWRVATSRRTVCVKRARPVLKTAAHWEAPVRRSAAEARWIERANELVPGCCPVLHHYDDEAHALILEYLDGSVFSTWKTELLAGSVEPKVAGSIGRLLRQAHTGMSTDADREGFANLDDFDALRLEPYLDRTAAAHPDLAPKLTELRASFTDFAATVVHGDVSPKNILVGPGRTVLLDAECATWGDPAFDIGFLLTHLCAKAVHLPAVRPALAEAAHRFLDSYAPDSEFSSRASRWLPGLLLARVDGASPLEYLSDDSRRVVRSTARQLLHHAASDVRAAVDRWFEWITGGPPSAS